MPTIPINWSDRMNHVARWQAKSVRNPGLAGRTASNGPALFKKFWPCHTVNSPVHAPATKQRFVCGIDDGIHTKSRYVTEQDLDAVFHRLFPWFADRLRIIFRAMEQNRETWILPFGLVLYTAIASVCVAGHVLWPQLFEIPINGGFGIWVNVAVGVVIGLSMVVLSWPFLRWSDSGRRLTDLLDLALRGVPSWGFPILSIAAGVGEELLFRGVLWSLVAKFGEDILALLVTSFLFGLAHGGFKDGLKAWTWYAMITGVCLGLLRMIGGEIAAPILAHATINAVHLPLVRHFGRLK